MKAFVPGGPNLGPAEAVSCLARGIDGVEQILAAELASYQERSRRFFSYLKTLGGHVTARQFESYRDNYFFRTATTLPSLRLLRAALDEKGDTETWDMVKRTIAEEEGRLDAAGLSHPALLERTHNMHGAKIFGLRPISLAQSAGSDLLLDEARTYRRVQQELYATSRTVALGVFLAQESTAQEMLSVFFDTFFLPNKPAYSDADSFATATAYFACHLDGLEATHARRAISCAARNCGTPQSVAELRIGIERFLLAQSNLWNALKTSLAIASG